MYSLLHTSISPNIVQAGYQVNVIPSEAEATLDIRALPDENIAAFYEMMRQSHQRPVANRKSSPNRATSAPVRLRLASIPTRSTPSKRPTRRSMAL